MEGDQRAQVYVGRRKAKKCSNCDATFSFLKFKKTCGQCNKVFCGSCASRKVQIPKYGHTKPTLVCILCFTGICVELKDRKSLEYISTKDLKKFAMANNIDFGDCVEKREMVDKILLPEHVLFTPTFYSLKGSDIQYTPINDGDKEKKLSKLEELPVASLKLILHNHGIDYSDCIEKRELVHKIQKFCPKVLEVAARQDMFSIPEQDQCIICYDRRIDTVLLECGHLCLCKQCSKSVAECPICRRMITRVVNTYHANK